MPRDISYSAPAPVWVSQDTPFAAPVMGGRNGQILLGYQVDQAAVDLDKERQYVRPDWADPTYTAVYRQEPRGPGGGSRDVGLPLYFTKQLEGSTYGKFDTNGNLVSTYDGSGFGSIKGLVSTVADFGAKAALLYGGVSGLAAGANALGLGGSGASAASGAGGLTAAEIAAIPASSGAGGAMAAELGTLSPAALAGTAGAGGLTAAEIAASDLAAYPTSGIVGPVPSTATTGLGGLTAAEINALTPAELAKYAPKGSSLYDYIKSRYTDENGDIKWSQALKDAAVVGSAAVAYNQAKDSNNGMPTGYQGKIPEYTGVREQLTPVAGRRPGAGGQRYFTDMKYADATGLPAAQAAITAQATALNAQNSSRPTAPPPAPPPAQGPPQRGEDFDRFFGRAPVRAAEGGLMGYAHGGGVPTKHEGTYLSGDTDGMADQIHATIDGKQPARLAHGEFVIPADVVSHLGNGNSDAGAKQLYKMMDRIRMARTGNKKQGKEIDPNKFAPGGIAAYAEGGAVQHFAAGDIVPTAANGIRGSESNLSNWVGPYVTNMLGKGNALSEQPYQAYQGPLTAGPSPLQQTGFQNAANLATPTSIGQAAATAGNLAGSRQTQSFITPGTAPAYMSPYMQNVVDVQQKEAQRQADIATTNRQGNQTQAGAFGGSRAAVMDAEAARNLALQQGQIQATGLQSAYDAAAKQFNTEQTNNLAGVNTQLQAAQVQGNLGATQNAAGLANLNAQLGAGGTQQALEQAGITADKAAFETERDNPYKMVQYQQSLLQGLPLAAQSYNITTNPYAAAANAAGGVYSMFNTIK